MLRLKNNLGKILLSFAAVSLIVGGIIFWLRPKSDERSQYNLALANIEKLKDAGFGSDGIGPEPSRQDGSYGAGATDQILRETENSLSQVASKSKNPLLRAKANYNLGILILTQALASGDLNLIDEARERLQASLVDDDANFKAKLYLEVIMKLKQDMAGQSPDDPNNANKAGPPGKPPKRLPRP